MDIKSLSLKNKLKDENGEEYFDLSVPSFNTSPLSIKALHFVTQDEVGRIDKICNSYYGSTKYIDMLCLVNHIFNPFSIQEHDALIIPEITSLEDAIYSMPVVPTWLSGSTTSTSSGSQTKQTNEKDENRINRLKRQSEKRKANELKQGQSVKKYINGKIILGTNLNIKNG